MAIKYELLGRKIEDMPTALNYETNSVIDVTGVTDTTSTVGIATTETSPVTFNSNSKFAQFIDIAVERGYELSQLEKEFLVVRKFKRIGADYETGKPAAYKQKAIVTPGDYASGNQALELSATLNWVGDKTFGTVDFNATNDKFTSETAPPASAEIHYKDGDARRADYQIFYIYDDSPTI